MSKSKLNPELEVGDTIRVIDIEYDIDAIKYNIPTRKLNPEMFVSYEVVDKESNGHKSKWPWRYTLVPEGEIWSTGRNAQGEMQTNEKVLYPWVHQWIYADTPMATKVDRKTISEHKELNISPDLEVGDIVRVIDVDGEHARMPDRFGLYKVIEMKQDNATQEFYYDIVPYPSPHPGNSDYNSSSYSHTSWNEHVKTLYRGDTWIYADVDRKTISEHKESKTELNPKLKVGDEIIVVDVKEIDGRGNESKQPEKYIRYFVTKIYHGDEFHRYPWSQKYYGLNRPDVDVTDPERPGVYDKSSIHKYLFPDDTWMFNPKGQTMRYEDAFPSEIIDYFEEGDPDVISEHKEELNQSLTMGDIIRVVDVDKDSTYDQPKYPYDTGNASGNSLMTPLMRGQLHGQDTYPYPMRLYAVMSKSLHRPKDRDYLNPYWMLWPVDKDGKVQDVKDFHEIILTDKDTWMTIKKHHSNIPGDIEAKHKEYVDSGRDIISRVLDEQDGEEGRIEDETDFGDGKPFTPLETRILNTLHKYLNQDELGQLSRETPENYARGSGAKFWNAMKLFGIEFANNEEEDTRTSRYAKWAYDNWTKEGDYGNIETPVKVPLKWYDVERSETGSQIEYKTGEAEVLGFDEDDASERADYDFYGWGGEMETNDWGDYEAYDSTIDGVEFTRMDEGLVRVLREDMDAYVKQSEKFISNAQKIQDLLFQFWMRKNIGPTLDPDKLKLIGFDMNNEEDKILV